MILKKLLAYALVAAFGISPARAGTITMPYPGPGQGAGTIALQAPVSIGTNSAAAGATSLTVATTGAIPAGSLAIVAIYIIKNSAISVSSVSDGTNTYALARTSTWDTNTFVTVELWYKANASAVGSGATVTATLSAATSSGDSLISTGYVIGALTAAPLDKVNSGSSGATPVTNTSSGSTGTLTITNEIALGLTGGYTSPSAAVSFTEATGFTVFTNQASSTRYFLHVGYQIVNATTALTYQPTLTNPALGAAVITTFKGN